MITKSIETPKLSDTEYRNWARNLVGKDWEIFWQEEEDGNEEDAKEIENSKTERVAITITTASGQQTSEDEKKETLETCSETGFGNANVQVEESSSDTVKNAGDSKATAVLAKVDNEESKIGGNDNENDNCDAVEGGVIDDWYDGHVLGIMNDTNEPIGRYGLKFRVHFLGDEEAYELFLVPDKIRPSARGWVQRSIALLNPPITASGENNSESFKLPPDTSTLDDQQSLQTLKSKMIDSSSSFDNLTIENKSTTYKAETLSSPSRKEFQRIQSLRFQLESQIYLRAKLSKIENHSGKEIYTNGVRNPTENYVNCLAQSCKDLAQACSWYCNSWELILYYFGNKVSDNNVKANETTCDSMEEEPCQRTDIGKLTFEELIRDYLEFGKNTIVNAAIIDINATGPSNKRRKALVPDSNPSSSRRTKRRRKTLKGAMMGAEDETEDKNSNLLVAASKLDTEILSTNHIEIFVKTLKENIHYWYIRVLGEMLQSLSCLVVNPLVSWKGQARRILGTKNTGNDTYNLMIDRVHANDVARTKTSPSDSDSEEVEEFFSYEEIETCLSAIRNNNAVSRFNLFDDVHKLHTKLADIQKNEARILAILKDLASAPDKSQEEIYDQNHDTVLIGLTAILNEIDSPESPLYNVDPLNAKMLSSPITRDDLSKAIELRTWLVDAQHAHSVRERNVFLERLLSKIDPINMLPDGKITPLLAHVPKLFEQRDALVQRTLEFKAKIENFKNIVEIRNKKFLASSGSVDISNSLDLKSHLIFLHSILSESKESPVIFPLEEKIAARIDLIQWYEKVQIMLGITSAKGEYLISFFELETLHESLQSVLRGFSITRANLIKGVESNSKANDEICKFLSSDLFSNCGETINKVKMMYSSSFGWKKRAESILFCLRTHGNSSAGETVISQKLPAMVDIKRIVDLTEEYPGLKTEIPGHFDQLQRIQSEAYQWSENLCNTLMDECRSFNDALSFIKKDRDQRPKGIIIYPTRTAADSIIDFLEWYEKIRKAAEFVLGELKESRNEDDVHRGAAAFSNLIIKEFYPILVDGLEALEIYCSNQISDRFKANSDESLRLLEKHFRIRKTSRASSRDKINSNHLISSLLSRMGTKDEKEGFPLRLVVWIQWHLLVTEFVSELGDDKNSGSHGDEVRSLQQAKEVQMQNPFFSYGTDLSVAPNTMTLIQTKTTELIELDKIIDDAQNAEVTIKKRLAMSKELLRGSLYEKSERVREHLNMLKSMLSTLKARSLGKGGLSINGAFENPLEQQIKYFTWLVRTLQYPVLHEGEASYVSSLKESELASKKISWDALVSIHERMPSEISEFGIPILCTLRVKELYAAAKKWQDEVSRSTLISNRGNKRRGTRPSRAENTIQPGMKDAEKDAKLCMRQMETLAEDPILFKVDMPRHKAVKAMVDAKKEFENELENFLAQDFDGKQDNAPLPKGNSLVGRNGQFILYRLTGSSLFSMMQTSIQSLAATGDNVFAETRGKAAFDWMRSAVTWIEELQDAVTKQSNLINANERFLVIPVEAATKLCKSGETIFLQTNKDVTHTFSNHGIYVSVNSIKKQLNVRLKKDGAHHSVGGIIIRWCPILFDALRADVAKLESWEKGIEKIAQNFNAFVNNPPRTDTNDDSCDLYQLYCYYMEVQTALEHGQNSLVVFPKKDTIDSFINLLGTMKKYLNENCPRDMLNEFSKRMYKSSASLYDNRFVLLDALLHRREIACKSDNGIKETPFTAFETEPSFRDMCRSNLEKALLKAAWVINLESEGIPGVEDLCALKAWEIEMEIHDSYQGERTDLASDSYKMKAQILKNNLENTNNLSLCLEILAGVMKANALVKMTAEQFSGRILKLKREKEKQAALRNEVSNSGIGDTVGDKITSWKGEKPLKSILKKKSAPLVFPKDSSLIQDAKNEEESKVRYNNDMIVDNTYADGAPTMDSEEEELTVTTSENGFSSSSSSFHYEYKGTDHKKHNYETPRSASLPPPPPPPSLADDFDTSAESYGNSSVNLTSRISNVHGSESFQIELQGQVKYAFSAQFYHESTTHANLNRILPESLIQRGRSKIDDFDRFLSEKLRGGRWQAISLRLATISDRDANIYSAFCRDFEAKERIAMFKIHGESGGKLFLVTPKFHHIAKRTRDVIFKNTNSTYAILLNKKGY